MEGPIDESLGTTEALAVRLRKLAIDGEKTLRGGQLRGAGWCRMSSDRPRRNRMNVRYLVPSVSRRLLSMGALILAACLQQPVHASSVDLSKFRRIEPQFIAALGDPGATF